MTDRPRVLQACPTYAGKEFALDAWAKGYKRTRYPKGRLGCLMVDNTRGTLAYTDRIMAADIRAIHINPGLTFEDTFLLAWQLIFSEAVLEKYDYIFSVEADNVIPPEGLSYLMDVAELTGAGIVTHTYPMHLLDQFKQGRTKWMSSDRFYYNELGCCLLKTEVVGWGLADRSRYSNTTAAIFSAAMKYKQGVTSVTDKLKIEHLDGYEMEFNQHFKQAENTGRYNPYEGMEVPNFNSVVPPSVKEDFERMGVALKPNLNLAGTPYRCSAAGSVIHGGNGKGKLNDCLPQIEAVAAGQKIEG